LTVVATQVPNLVGGEWRPSASGRWTDVTNPADGREIVAQVPAMDADDVADAYASAQAGAGGWATTSAVARGRILLRAGQLLRERWDEIARDLTREMGKTLAEARGEVGKSADFLEYCGGLGRAPQGEVLADERAGARVWTVHEPVGVVLAVCPWNDPLLTPARKLGPALIAGNAVVLKPASYTPLVSLHLARALADAGLPPGVLNTVTGPSREIGAALIGNPALGAVSFTGSNEVGEALRRDLSGGTVKLLAELGGKNAAVVLADADLDQAAATLATAAFAQAGQRCTATSRVLVSRAVLGEMLERIAGHARNLVLGPGLDAETTMGPLVAAEQRQSVGGFIDRAIADGAELVAGEEGLDERLAYGHFCRAAILVARPSMEIWREEVFGPVVSVVAIDDVDEAIAVVNDSPYGLAAGVFTTDLGAALRFIDGVDVGQVAVNLPTSGWDVHMPFGGFKGSGSGSKEQGLEGLAFYSRTKTVAMAASS
jgi:aldehyde dehydrogenase (NAD+)